MDKRLRIPVIAVLSLAIILSCTVLGSRLTDAATYSHSIEVLDKNRATVLSLSAASAAASAAVSALPTDICAPLADELSEFSTWFLIILTVIYLEKYLLTIFGALACYLLIPLGCCGFLACCFFPNDALRRLGIKLLAFSAALLLVIPTGVWVSDRVNEIYADSIEVTVESASAVSESLLDRTSDGENDNSSVIDKAAALLDDVSGSVSGVVAQFKNVINRFLEATAVMVVTTCLIPILVILFFAWMVKTLFGTQIILPQRLTRPLKRRIPTDSEWE